MAGYVGNIPVPQGTQTRQSFTATASQTSFPTIGYTEGFIDVHLNGVKLLAGVDFNVGGGNGSDVILATGAALNDILEVTIFDTFDTSSGTFSNTTLKNNVTLKNDTEQDTDGGRASKIIYQGEQSGGEISTLAEIEASHDLSADDEKGNLIFRTNDGSDGTSPTETLRLKSDGNLLLGTTVAGRAAEGADRLTIADAAHSGLTIRSGSTSYGSINFSDSEGGAGEYAGSIFFGHGTSLGERLTFATAGSNRASIDSDGLKFNNDTAADNALNDYEEGTWTPSQGNFSTWSSPNFDATYVKVGKLVTARLRQSAGTVGWSASQFMGGLPFTSVAGSSAYATDSGPTSDNGPVLIWTGGNAYFQAANSSESGLVVTFVYETS